MKRTHNLSALSFDNARLSCVSSRCSRGTLGEEALEKSPSFNYFHLEFGQMFSPVSAGGSVSFFRWKCMEETLVEKVHLKPFFFTQIKFEKNDLRVVGILWGSKLLALLLLLLLPFFSFVTLFALNASQRASTAKGKKRSLE